jgi:hypothetical protein
MKRPGLHINGSHADTFTINHHQVQSKVFNKKVTVVLIHD